MEATLHRLPRFPHARSSLAVLLAVFFPLVAAGLVMLSPSGAPAGLAAAVTPPPPPTFVPTVIPPPPGPPAPTATPVPPTATPAASGSATATAQPTTAPAAAPTPTSSPATFALEAARVSKLRDPGDLAGLAAVRPGSHVWLMMYYTLHALPHTTNRVATYDILSGSRLIYRIVFRATEKKGADGRFVKYTVYHLPSSLPFGTYRFRATLALSGQTQAKTWKFRLAAHDHVVYHTGALWAAAVAEASMKGT